MVYGRFRVVEYRDNRFGGWRKSYMDWTGEDVLRLNKLVGYEKYRERYA